MISFVLKGFSYKDQIEELFIVMVLLYVFPTRNIVNFLVNFTHVTTVTYFSMARYDLFVLKAPLNPNQSVNQSIAAVDRCSVSTGVGQAWFIRRKRYPSGTLDFRLTR